LSKNPIPLAKSFEDCQEHFSELGKCISATLVTLYRSRDVTYKEKQNMKIGMEAMQKSLEQLADNLREL
tara:strand:+ start:142 stop:348 length:207 start_codon:yes stop_codon:yes gene_type:complete